MGHTLLSAIVVVRVLSMVVFGCQLGKKAAAEERKIPKKEKVTKTLYTYAIVIKKSTFEDENWKKVVDTLKEKHNGQVFV